MNNSTAQNLLKKVIATAKLSVEENAQKADACHSNRVDLFTDEGMDSFDLEATEQDILTEADDEALLNSL